MIMAKVSIIIPVYNKEEVLEKNIQSVLNQTLKDIEVILINDGSTDYSGEICNKIKQSDKRVKVVHQENGGTSVARNTGISVATGNYIGFMDPDDWIEPNMYENMYGEIQKNQSEVCICNYYVVTKKARHPIAIDLSFDILDKNQTFENLVLNMISTKTLNSSEKAIAGTVWRLLIDRKSIEKYDLSFVPGLTIMQDLVFSVDLFTDVKNVCIDRNFNYHYIQIDDSAIHKYRDNIFELNSKVNTEIIKILKGKALYKKSYNRIRNRYIISGLSIVQNEIQSNKPINESLNKISKVCQNENIKKTLENIDFNNLSLRKQIVLSSLKNNRPKILYIYYFFLEKVTYLLL